VVNRIDPGGRGITTTVKVGGRPEDVAVGDGSVWVVDPSKHDLIEISAESGTIARRLRVGDRPTSVSVGGGSVWVGDEGTGAVARVAL
jgi:streptogramin lyase